MRMKHSTQSTRFGTHSQHIFKVAYVCFSTRFILTASILGKCQGLTITAFNSGHSLGGTIWKIRSPSSGTIVYAVDLNHLRERHLDGTVLLRGSGSGGVFEALARPDIFITDADRVHNIMCRRKDRDAQLIGLYKISPIIV